MPEMNHWRTDRPDERLNASLTDTFAGLPVRSAVPHPFVLGYPYPLVVLFHGRGGNEEQVMRAVPKVSRQNFAYLSLRGPEPLGRRKDGKAGFGWAHQDADGLLEEYVRLSVALIRQSVHIHTERVYLMGVNEGADAAYRAGFALAGQVAGVIALNGTMPRPDAGQPVQGFGNARQLRVFIGHGASKTGATQADVVRDYRALYAAGADVSLRQYGRERRPFTPMLRDVNRWIISNINAEHDAFAVRD